MADERAHDVVSKDATEGKFVLVAWCNPFSWFGVGIIFDNVAVGTDGLRSCKWFVAFLLTSEEAADG